MSGGRALAAFGLLIGIVTFVVLSAVCAFDDGALANDWTGCIIPLGILLVPFALTGVAFASNKPGYLIAACLLLVPVAVLSFVIGVGVVLLAAAVLFGIAYARWPSRVLPEGTLGGHKHVCPGPVKLALKISQRICHPPSDIHWIK